MTTSAPTPPPGLEPHVKSSCFDDAEEEPEEVFVTPRRDTSLCAIGSPYTPMKSSEPGVNYEGQEDTSVAVCSVVEEIVEINGDVKANIEDEARRAQHDTSSAADGLRSRGQASCKSPPDSWCRNGVNLLGRPMRKQQQDRMLQELVAGVSQVMLAKGFNSIQQGIQINQVMDNKFGVAALLS